MTDDGLVYVDGRVTSLREVRLRESIEHELAALEADRVLTEMALDRLRERDDILHHERRMKELHNHLARLRAGNHERRQHRRTDLIYKVRDNARIFR
jgi:hypothetical protein